MVRGFDLDQALHRSDHEHGIAGSKDGIMGRIDVHALRTAMQDDVHSMLGLNLPTAWPTRGPSAAMVRSVK